MNTEKLIAVIHKTAAKIEAEKAFLTELDNVIGDGDHGINLARGFGEVEKKLDALADKEVVSSKCYLCRRNLRKKIRWFSPNGKNYYCLAHCEKHGYLKGKIRVRKTDEDKVYIVKTTRLVSPEDAVLLKTRREHIRTQHKIHEIRKSTVRRSRKPQA